MTFQVEEASPLSIVWESVSLQCTLGRGVVRHIPAWGAELAATRRAVCNTVRHVTKPLTTLTRFIIKH
jgi:hypothetical protein